MKKLILSLSFLLTSVFVYSQITFERTYGGTGDDIGYSVFQTSDSGYVIAGAEGSSEVEGYDVYLIKTNAHGDTIWTKTWGGFDPDIGYSITQTYDKGYFIVGLTESFGISAADVYLIKTDNNGNTIWTKTFDGGGNDYGYSVSQTNDSGFIITGSKQINFSNNVDIYLIKTNINGNIEWVKTFGGIDSDLGKSVIQTNDNGYAITGITVTMNHDADIFLIKTNSNGDTIWTKTYGGINNDHGNSVVQTSDGGYAIVGTINLSLATQGIYVVRTNGNGDTIWTKNYGGASSQTGYSIAETNDDGFIIAGNTYRHGASEIYLIKIDLNGDTIWTREFSGSEWASSRYISLTSDNGYIITGCTWSYGPGGNDDVYLIKTDSNGISNGTLGINNQSSKPNNNLIIYPNPSSWKINIQVPKQFKQTKTLEIFNCTGQLQLTKTDNFSTIDLGSLKSGLYFIVLTNSENEKIASKIIKE